MLAKTSIVQESLSSGPSFSSSGTTPRSTTPRRQSQVPSQCPLCQLPCPLFLQLLVLLCWWVPLLSLLCFLVSVEPSTTSPIWMLCACKVGSTLGSLNGHTPGRAGAEGRARSVQGSVCSSPPVVTYFYTVCASDFVGKDSSAPKIKIDLIYSPMGKTETHRVNGLSDILGSEVAQLGQNPGSLSQVSTAVTKPAARDDSSIFLCFSAPSSACLPPA